MNNNDLINALTGLDPKYIDEAAFDLHDGTYNEASVTAAGNTTSGRAAKAGTNKVRIRRIVYVTLPAAAAILLTFSVALPAIMRMGKSESASMAESDSAVYEAEDNMAAEAPESYDSAEDSAAKTAESYGSIEYADEAAPDSEPVFEAEEAYESDAFDGSSSADVTTDQAVSEAAAEEHIFSLEKATYKDGILTVEVNGIIPEDTDSLEYAIKGTAGNDPDKTFAKGMLGDILSGQDPLTLDLSGLELSEGRYSLLIGTEITEFTVQP